jgi:hypothetical protein
MLNERPIPEGALRDKDAVEMLRVWDAERQFHCSIKVGMYHETMDIPEGRAWGVILADVARHIATAMESTYSADRAQIVQEIRDNYLKELDSPTSDTVGEFVQRTEAE